MENTGDEKILRVSAIKDGTVIDHIPSNRLFDVISILRLDQIDTQITFGCNLESKKLGRKAIIKIADKYFEDEELNKIALIYPEAKLSVIKDYKVTEKKIVELPEEIVGIARCFNPKCITNHEVITTRFNVVEKHPVALQCYYCEKITTDDHIRIV